MVDAGLADQRIGVERLEYGAIRAEPGQRWLLAGVDPQAASRVLRRRRDRRGREWMGPEQRPARLQIANREEVRIGLAKSDGHSKRHATRPAASNRTSRVLSAAIPSPVVTIGAEAVASLPSSVPELQRTAPSASKAYRNGPAPEMPATVQAATLLFDAHRWSRRTTRCQPHHSHPR